MDSTHIFHPFASWTQHPRFEIDQAVHELVASQHELSGIFEQLYPHLSIDITNVHTDFTSLQTGLRRVDLATKALLPPIYFNELHRHNHAAVPHRALETAEVLENILLHLSFHELLLARQVSRQFRAVVDETQILRQMMFLHPDDDTTFFRVPFNDSNELAQTLLPETRPHLTISSYLYSSESSLNVNQKRISIKLTCTDGLHHFSIRAQYRRMLVSQPPLKKISLESVSCCKFERDHLRSYYDRLPEIEPLEVDTGITIGHVYDLAEKVAKEHMLCPLAPALTLDKDGLVNPEIKFSGIVDVPWHKLDGVDLVDPFCNEAGSGCFIDPFCLDPWTAFPTSPRKKVKKSQKKVVKKKAKEDAKQQAHLEAYRLAKVLAAHNEVPIPTLEEYDEKRVYYESLTKPFWFDTVMSRHY